MWLYVKLLESVSDITYVTVRKPAAVYMHTPDCMYIRWVYGVWGTYVRACVCVHEWVSASLRVFATLCVCVRGGGIQIVWNQV
jgi:hypothetical protein